MELPKKKFKIIYADPPWSYKDKALAGNRGACCKYPVMNIEDIKNLPVKDIEDDDCVLFLWVTFPKLNECFEVIKNWPLDNAWKVVCTNFELNPTHRSGPTKKTNHTPPRHTFFGFQGL